jgi:major outer membrane protein
MRPRKSGGILVTRLSLAGIGALVLLAAASPARAADKDYKGWFAALDLATTQPDSLDQHFADEAVAPASDNFERLVIDNRSHLSWKGSVGYDFGKELGSLQASYWIFDHEDKDSGTAQGDLLPTIFGFGYGPGAMYITAPPTSFVAKSKIKARTYDLDYLRPIAVGEKFAVRWLAGLRTARYEEDLNFSATDSAAFQYRQSKHLESKAMGLRVGATGVFGFTKHFGLEASMAVSFMQADNDFNSSETFVNAGTMARLKGSNKHDRGEIRDYDFKALWSYGHLDYFVGYQASEWDGLVEDSLPAGGCCTGSPGNAGRQTIAFNSFHGGVIWRFGRAKESPPPLQ